MIHVLRLPLVVVLALAAPCAVASSPPLERPLHYTLEALIDPASGGISVAGRVQIERSDLNRRRLEFDLHETFEIADLRVNGVEAPFAVEPNERGAGRSTARAVVISLPKRIREAHLLLEITYGGILARLPQSGSAAADAAGRWLDDAIGDTRVELSWSSAWFPQIGGFGSRFSTEIAVHLPDGWTAVAPGASLPESVDGVESRVVWRCSSSNDIVVVAAPNLRRLAVERFGVAVELFDTRLPDAFRDREADNAARTLELFADVLGEPTPSQEPVRAVYSPRSLGRAGFSRPALTVLSEGRVLSALRDDSRLSLLRGTAHEAAHFWWNFGADDGGWINEALAEYFALVAVENIDDRSAYEGLVDGYRTSVARLGADAPPLADLSGASPQVGQVLRYQKGSLLLHAFRKTMGDKRFFSACREFYQRYHSTGATQSDFRSFWKSALGKKGDIVDRWIDSPGGIPK
jgi:aminopeptidase N